MASARTIIRMVAMQEESPAKVLRKVNNILIADMPSARFVTLVYAVIDANRKMISIANAGHHNPVIKSDKRIHSPVIEVGLPLGIIEYDYKEYNLQMNSNDKLFLYSDGVPEAMNSKEELFDDERIAESLMKNGSNVDSLYQDVKKFTGNIPLSDDLTIVMIESE